MGLSKSSGLNLLKTIALIYHQKRIKTGFHTSRIGLQICVSTDNGIDNRSWTNCLSTSRLTGFIETSNSSLAFKLSKSACSRLIETSITIQPCNFASLQRRRVSFKGLQSVSLVGFFPSEILPSVTIACTQRNTVSICFHSTKSSPASNRNSCCGIPNPGEHSEGPTFATLHSPTHNTPLHRS